MEKQVSRTTAASSSKQESEAQSEGQERERERERGKRDKRCRWCFFLTSGDCVDVNHQYLLVNLLCTFVVREKQTETPILTKSLLPL